MKSDPDIGGNIEGKKNVNTGKRKNRRAGRTQKEIYMYEKRPQYRGIYRGKDT